MGAECGTEVKNRTVFWVSGGNLKENITWKEMAQKE
jgi:hypothetical protein